LNILESLGLFLAGFGFVYLMLPSASSPSLQGFILMSVSGAAWGFYTILGQGSQAALLDTAVNFKRSIPFVLLLVLASYPYMHLSKMGVFYAVLSGTVASGVGYTFWYMAVAKLQTLHAAVVQLFVPVIAAVGGIILLAEPLSTQLILSSALILGGILMVVIYRSKPNTA
jgi:drug/metabolite transporter (DMT)-like permease